MTSNGEMARYLELPRAILAQLYETRLCNEMVEEAIKDIDSLLAIIQSDGPVEGGRKIR